MGVWWDAATCEADPELSAEADVSIVGFAGTRCGAGCVFGVNEGVETSLRHGLTGSDGCLLPEHETTRLPFKAIVSASTFKE